MTGKMTLPLEVKGYYKKGKTAYRAKEYKLS